MPERIFDLSAAYRRLGGHILQIVLLHTEIQSRGGDNLPFRMAHYHALIFAHYKKEPVALAFLTEGRPANEARNYEVTTYGTLSRYDYNLLDLLELARRRTV